MSTTETAIPGNATRRMWRVRSDKGEVYGPADTDTLKTWAQEGRMAPTSSISEDGQKWIPVTALPEIEMDWVAEISTGVFFGPIHRNALTALIRDGSVSNAAPLFRRVLPGTQPVTDRERALETRIHEIQHQLYARIAELEALVSTAKTEVDRSRNMVVKNEQSFEKERDQFRQMLTTQQEEITSRDKHIAGLGPLVSHVENLESERQRLAQQVLVMEQRADELTRLRDEAQTLAEQARRENSRTQSRVAEAQATQAAASQTINALRDRMQGLTREVDTLREASRQSRTRLETVRKLLQQAAATAGTTLDAPSDADVVSAPSPTNSNPAIAPAAPAAPTPAQLLANIEAQAQRELRQISNAAQRGERDNP